MSSYAPDVRQFNKQRHADARRHEKHVQRQREAVRVIASPAGLKGITSLKGGVK
jgi:hypothetical protein